LAAIPGISAAAESETTATNGKKPNVQSHNSPLTTFVCRITNIQPLKSI
jgi:hypothetical protein